MSDSKAQATMPPVTSQYPSIADTVRARRDVILSRNQMTASYIAALNATVLATLLYAQANPTFLLVWYVAALGQAALRIGLETSTRAVAEDRQSKVRIFNNIALSLMGGLIWGASVFTLLPDADPLAQSLIAFMIAGMTAGASVAFSTHIRIVLAFNAPALALPALYLAMQGNAMQLGMSMLMVVYFIATLSLVRRSNDQVTRALENEIAAGLERSQLEEQKRLVDKEVIARNRSESRLMGMLAQARSFNMTLERIFQAYITHDRSSESFIKMVVEELSNALAIERVSVWFLTPEGDAIVCQDLFEASTGRHSKGDRFSAADYPAYFDAINSSMAIVASDAYADPRTCSFADSYLDPLGIVSMLDLPLNGASGVRGAICCESVSVSREWNAEEVAFATAVSQFVSMCLMSEDSRHLAEALRAAMIEAQNASATKSAFLANMSHEIRTPMNGVMGMLDLLRQTPLNPDQLDRLDTARTSASVLLAILDDVLDISKLEAGQVCVETNPFNVRDLTNNAIALFTPKADSKKLSLTAHFAPKVPETVASDDLRIKQVLANLLGNAIKFTPSGSIHIDVRYESVDTQDYLRFEIADTGIGIPEEAQATLFDRFVQADSSTTREFGGTGLGLAICKQLVALMGGKIGFVSAPGKGSTFWFTISASKADPQDAPEPETDIRVPLSPSPRRLLVAEDNPVNQKVIRAFLEAAGHHMEIVTNGAQALAAAQNNTFDLILMDIQMPVMDGVTATKAIRALNGPQRDIPIIALTANAMAGDEEKYLHQGMTGYVSKPIDPADLFSKIGQALADTPQPVEQETSQPHAPDAPASVGDAGIAPVELDDLLSDIDEAVG